MGFKSEKAFQNYVLKRLRLLPLSYWYKANDRTTAGIPDIIGCVRGTFVGIELKVTSKVSKIQDYTIDKINRAGGVSFVMTPDTFEKDFQLLKRL